MGKGTGQFDMDVVETYIGVNKYFVVAMHLAGLVRGAAPCPLVNILLQVIPSKTFHDSMNVGFGAFGRPFSEGNWNNRSGNASGSPPKGSIARL